MKNETNAARYINRRIYTDVESWLVTDIDETKGTATATPVEKNIRPKLIPGGFFGHCPNLSDEFRAAEPVVAGESFPIIRNKRGDWGYWRDNVVAYGKVNAFASAWVEEMKKTPEKIEITADGNLFVYELTKTGKRKRKFEVLGNTISAECAYFYDYNF